MCGCSQCMGVVCASVWVPCMPVCGCSLCQCVGVVTGGGHREGTQVGTGMGTQEGTQVGTGRGHRWAQGGGTGGHRDGDTGGHRRGHRWAQGWGHRWAQGGDTGGHRDPGDTGGHRDPGDTIQLNIPQLALGICSYELPLLTCVFVCVYAAEHVLAAAINGFLSCLSFIALCWTPTASRPRVSTARGIHTVNKK